MFPAVDPFWSAVTEFAFRAMIVWGLVMFVGTPILLYAAIRFFWYRHVYVGKSKELEKLIWQLHRVASALEKTNGDQVPIDQSAVTGADSSVHLSMFGR